MDTIQDSADPSASLPQAKRSLPRTCAAHVFQRLLPQTFRGACFTRLASTSGAEREFSLSKQGKYCSACVGAALVGLHSGAHAYCSLSSVGWRMATCSQAPSGPFQRRGRALWEHRQCRQRAGPICPHAAGFAVRHRQSMMCQTCSNPTSNCRFDIFVRFD